MGKGRGRFFLLGFLLCILLGLFGCGGGSGPKSKAQSLPDLVEIPEDGIITKEQFETFAGEDRKVTFTGETDGIVYSWIYDGRQIMNPQDQNLKLTIVTEGLEEIKDSANHAAYALGLTIEGEELICAPTLTIRLPDLWEADMAILVREQKGKLARVTDVMIDKEEVTTLSWNMTSIPGTCYIVAGKSAGAAYSAKGQPGVGNRDGQAANQAMGQEASDPGTSATGDQGGINSEKGSSSDDGSSGDKAASSGSVASGDKTVAGSSAGSGSGDKTIAGSSSGSSSGDKTSGSKTSGDKTSGSQTSGNKTSANKTSSGKDSGSKTSKSLTCKISINCSTILNNMDKLAAGKEEFVPSNGWILKETSVEFKEGDSVFDILQSVCRSKGIHMESANTILYGSAYIEGINQLYEFDCGELSGWMFSVNGWYPNYGCSKYTVSDGDVIRWIYTCELGQDLE